MPQSRLTLLVLIAPAVALLALLAVWPILRVAALSLFDTDYGLDGASFVAFENYARALDNRFFRRAIENTIVFTLAATALEVTLGLALALLFVRAFPGRRLALPLVVFPLVLSIMVVSSIWRSWFHYDVGFLNNLLDGLGLPRVAWLFDPDLALWSIVLIDVWQYTPLTFLILLAGLQAIPKEVVEAARIDGAGSVRVFLTITLPLIAGHLALAALLRTIDTFKLFDKVYALTGGGPGTATETMSLYVYRQGFRFFEVGLASAAAMLMLVVSLALAALYALHVARGATR